MQPSKGSIIKSKAWLFKGLTVFTTVEGNLVLTRDAISMHKIDGSQASTYLISQIAKVVASEGQLHLHLDDDKVRIAFYNPKEAAKFASLPAATSLGGVGTGGQILTTSIAVDNMAGLITPAAGIASEWVKQLVSLGVPSEDNGTPLTDFGVKTSKNALRYALIGVGIFFGLIMLGILIGQISKLFT